MKGKEKMLTSKEIAERLNRPYSTIALWLRQGRFPNAVKDESSPRGVVYFVPESDLKNFQEPERGRPAKPLPELKSKPHRKASK
jgi:hypothetical protein